MSARPPAPPSEEAFRRRESLVEALHQTSLGLLSRSGTDGLLEDIVSRAAKLADAPEGYVYVVDEATDELVVRAAVGSQVIKYMGLRLKRGEGIAGRAWEGGEPLVVSDYAVWQGRSPRIQRDDVRAVAVFPLQANGRLLGVLGIFHTDPAKSFDEERLWLLGRYAQLAAVALDHALLLADLRESEERFRVAFEHSTIGRGVSLPDGRWVRVNRALCDMLGYTEAELLGRRSDDVTHPDDVAATQEARRAMVEGGSRLFDLEKRYLRKDGSVLWARATVSCVRDAAGQVRYLVGDIMDLSGKRRMEEAVREQAVTRSLVRSMLQDIGRAGHLPHQLMRDLGRRLANEVEGKSLGDWLAAFAAMGLGRLEVVSSDGVRFTLRGVDLLEYVPGAREPSCHLPLGFLEGAYFALTGREGLGAELRCQSLRHPECLFVVAARPGRR